MVFIFKEEHKKNNIAAEKKVIVLIMIYGLEDENEFKFILENEICFFLLLGKT
jgi:hypothetical protein